MSYDQKNSVKTAKKYEPVNWTKESVYGNFRLILIRVHKRPILDSIINKHEGWILSLCEEPSQIQ